mgnify:CR=1 FL=1
MSVKSPFESKGRSALATHKASLATPLKCSLEKARRFVPSCLMVQRERPEARAARAEVAHAVVCHREVRGNKLRTSASMFTMQVRMQRLHILEGLVAAGFGTR